MDENLSQTYLDDLNKTETPDSVLMEFFVRAFEVTPTVNMRIMFRRLIKMYGRQAVFMAILDVYDMQVADATKPYGILAYFIKKRIESKTTPIEYLTAEDMDKRIAKIKRGFKKMDLTNPIEEKMSG